LNSNKFTSTVREVAFEAGSKLREIEDFAFAGCCLLDSICLPASIEVIHGAGFPEHASVEIASGHPFLSVKGDFVVDSRAMCLVRYFGNAEEVTIPDEIETLGPSCFIWGSQIRAVRLESMTRLRSIPESAFGFCTFLESISIPSSVTILSDSSFAFCPSLHTVSFRADSQLKSIGERAFDTCEGLKSIAVPRTVETMAQSCFKSCTKLEAIVFGPDSKLIRIEELSFWRCCSLQSILLPPLVEYVGSSCFHDCESLRNLTFSLPARLRELLDLPPQWSGLQEIPDSVEILSLERTYRPGLRRILSFGCESRLAEIRLAGSGLVRCFLRVSSRTLSTFRRNLEFESEKPNPRINRLP
jgi:hypothetical protein